MVDMPENKTETNVLNQPLHIVSVRTVNECKFLLVDTH